VVGNLYKNHLNWRQKCIHDLRYPYEIILPIVGAAGKILPAKIRGPDSDRPARHATREKRHEISHEMVASSFEYEQYSIVRGSLTTLVRSSDSKNSSDFHRSHRPPEFQITTFFNFFPRLIDE